MMRLLLLICFLIPLNGLRAEVPQEVHRQAVCLQRILHQADDAYFNKHDSIMSDASYDALRNRYDQLVQQYPTLKALKRIGAPPVDRDEKVAHSNPVLSLQKAYSDVEVIDFIEKTQASRFRVEPKIDGLTVILRYQNGVMTRALTRGDGKQGSDVTEAILASGCVPAKLNQTPATLEVRGEVYLTFDRFAKLNARRETLGLSKLKSPRNSAAGTLRLNDFAEIARRGLQIQIFEIRETEPMPKTHQAGIDQLISLGLNPVAGKTVQSEEVLATVAELNNQRKTLPYLIDGIVIKVDSCKKFNELGSTSHHPRGALARKYKTISMETTLLKVIWSKGPTGRITPIATFEPVEIEGATIEKATLHNLDHLRALDLKIGDRIQVTRAGGSVPEILGISPGHRDGSETTIPDPKRY